MGGTGCHASHAVCRLVGGRAKEVGEAAAAASWDRLSCQSCCVQACGREGERSG